MSEQGRTLPPFPVNVETLAMLKEALRTSLDVAEDGTRTKVGGAFTMSEILDFYSGSDQNRSTYIGEMELLPGIEAPTYEMWDQHYSVNDVVLALINALEATR